MSTDTLEQLDPKYHIIVKGAKVNNLKDLSVAIPRNKLVVVTGVSGSGKSSLAFDTLFAEGQRMYVESLSSYARQFLGRMEKPAVDYIKGVCPAIAVEQKVNTKNPRSTVGTTTEVYDYMKLLFARIGKTYSPVSGEVVGKDTVSSVSDFLQSQAEGTKFMILAPLKLPKERALKDELKVLLQKGFSRVQLDGEISFIEELLEKKLTKKPKNEFDILIDRGSVRHGDEDYLFRIADSIQTAFFEGHGDCLIDIFPEGSRTPERHAFSDRFELDGMEFEEPSVNLFSFNNPYGACKTCEGFGSVIGIDEDLVVPDKSLSVYDGAIAPWRTETMKRWVEPLLKNGIRFDFPIHRPFADLTPEEQQLVWEGNEYFDGLNAFFKHLQSKTHKIQYRVLLSKYRGRRSCPDCRGTRLRKDAHYVKIAGHSIIDLVLMPVEDTLAFFQNLELSEHDTEVAQRLLTEIRHRLGFLQRVGLGYLTLNRLTSTLSGGEYQRIKLATSLGSALVGSMYILDEPSIGLHPRDTRNLVSVLLELRDLGNTVIVVEHEEEVMLAADEIIDIGPDAGEFGGQLVFQGNHSQLDKARLSHTARFLSGKDVIEKPRRRREWQRCIKLIGARENNLKNLKVEFPLEVMTVITGVSGSGKSTLVKQLLFPAMSRQLDNFQHQLGKMDRLEGDMEAIDRIEFVDQNPIGKSSRSNPVTYVKAYDAIRGLYSEQPMAKQRGFKPAHFSFNVDGGRCEACQGEGTQKVEMQFMADIYLTCESCKGKRFKSEVLEVNYRGKTISDVLDMSIDEAISFFKDQRKITDRLLPLQEVGLGYIRLGQSSNTLSGGEAQRVKLASFLVKGTLRQGEKVLFIFDEPTTGLHFADIKKLLHSLNALIDEGHTVIIIEHNMEIIKSADWVLDLGPEGGHKGGQLCYAGTPEGLAKLKGNHTAEFLKGKV